MNTMRPGLLKITALVLLAGTARANDEYPVSMWQINGDTNRIYLLGSIHLLREQDHPLPASIYTAYNDAEKLIMELDMDDMDPSEGQALTNQLGLIHDGRTLSDLLGPDLYDEAEALATTAQIPITLLAKAEPWFAAMNIEIMLLMRMGFSPSFGIETHLMERAMADNKEILGFETMRQQLEFLDGLSEEAQNAMLIQTLTDGVELEGMMDTMIDAWRKGDMQFMEDNLLADMENYPELNRVIVVDRNIDWTNQIEGLMDDDIDYLIVVGTLHLVGDAGVPELLEARGYEAVQMKQSAN
ncbi:MAG: TraB/GumN family protein [Woeseiaceae bacterium]|nr:TraB/GumN family protein [Woeseiaceae bacterium]